MQSLHGVRDRWVGRRTSVINQIRGLLLERGITLRKGRRHAEASLPGILGRSGQRLVGAATHATGTTAARTKATTEPSGRITGIPEHSWSRVAALRQGSQRECTQGE